VDGSNLTNVGLWEDVVSGVSYPGGNVGIGTTNPSQRLVVGNDIGSISGNEAIVIGGAGTSNVQFFMGNNGDNFGNILWNGANQDLILRTKSNGTNHVNQLVLDSTGRVGLGTTSPEASLDIKSSGSQWTLQNWNKSLKLSGGTAAIEFDIGLSSKFGMGATTSGGDSFYL